jgi:hypothetical protein
MKLNDLKNKYPEAVVGAVGSICNETKLILNEVHLFTGIKKEREDTLKDNINLLIDFFEYVSPLIEPIAYCRIDEVKLVGKATYKNIEEIQNYLIDLNDAVFSNERIDPKIIHIVTKIKQEIDLLVSKLKHPYQ